MTPAEQKAFIQAKVQNYKGNILDVVKAQSKTAGIERYGFDPMKRTRFNKFGPAVQKRALKRYHEMFGKPKEGEMYDFEVLVLIGKKIEKRGFQ